MSFPISIKPLNSKIGRIALLGCVIYLSFSIRTLNVQSWQQKYLLDPDSYRFLRQAEVIVSQGRLPAVDTMRWVPLGRDLSTHLNLYSYCLAFSYRLVKLIRPDVTLYQVALYSSVICYLFALLFLYLVWKHLFTPSVALLSVNLLAVLPSFTLHRSTAGFADRDAFCLLLWIVMIYLYLKAVDEQSVKGQIYAGSSGIVAGLLALSWEGSGLGIAIITSWNALRLLRNHFDRSHFLTYNVWYTCFILIALLFTRAYRDWTKPYVLLAVGAPTFVWLCALIFLMLQHNTPWIRRLTLNHRLPKGVVSFGLGIVTFGLILTFFASVQSKSVVEISGALLDNFLSPLGRSRLMRTIAELYNLSGFRWVQQYSVILIAAICGSVLLAYRFFAKEPVRLSMAIVGFEITLCGTLLSLFPAVAQWSDGIYLMAVLAGGVTLVLSYLLTNKRETNRLLSTHENRLLVLLWFMITLFVTRGAERYGFFLDPVLMLLY